MQVKKFSKYRPTRLVLVRYLDHAMYLNQPPGAKVKPTIREVVGWVYEENEYFIYVVYDRDVDGKGKVSGLTLFKEGVIEILELRTPMSVEVEAKK